MGLSPGRQISAQEALQLGIVDQVTEGNAIQVAMELALSVIGVCVCVSCIIVCMGVCVCVIIACVSVLQVSR